MRALQLIEERKLELRDVRDVATMNSKAIMDIMATWEVHAKSSVHCQALPGAWSVLF